jgi:hypothetical protein
MGDQQGVLQLDDQTSRSPSAADSITLTADMRPVAGGKAERPIPSGSPRPARGLWLVATLAALLGLGGIGAAGLTYWESQREILRLSTELAQLRVSLDLYAQRGSSGSGLADVTERLDALESQAAASPATAATASTPTVSTTPTGEDCLPPGMRLLVAVGDSYPICGQTAAVDVGVVDNGYISLADGTTVPSGSTVPMPGSACTISVTSSGDEGLTGYAEIRVNC